MSDDLAARLRYAITDLGFQITCILDYPDVVKAIEATGRLSLIREALAAGLAARNAKP